MGDEPRRPRSDSMVQRVYRALLRLQPFEFRAEFARDIEQAFSEEHEEVKARRNARETLRFWLRTAADVTRTAPREHWDVLRQDARAGVRLLTRNPGLAITAILTLALAIGGSTSIFSVVYAVVLRPLAFPESERVARIGWVIQNGRDAGSLGPASFRDVETLGETSTAFEAIGAIGNDFLSSERGTVSVTLPDSVKPVGVGRSFITPMMASASIFRIFGTSTVLGRLPDHADEQPGSTPVAVLSHSTWTSVYGRDPDVIGRTLVRRFGTDREKTVTIVGVLRQDAFRGVWPNEAPAWSSLDRDLIGAHDPTGRAFNLRVYARLADGASVDAARAELARLTPHLASGLPDYLASSEPSLSVTLLRDEVVGRARAPLLAFLAAVSCLLLLASVNVASLVLARAISRRREFAARFALGARPLRVARQLLTESAILAICGGALGLAVAWAGVRAFVAVSPPMPRLDESGIGVPAVLFALGGVLLGTCAAGLVPALHSSRRSVADGLRRVGGGPATATPFSKPLALLAAGQIALVLVLLAATGLLVNSFARLVLFDLGFDPRSLMMIAIDRTGARDAGPQVRNGDTEAVLSNRERLLRSIDDELIRRVSVIPGVSAVGLTGDDPFGPPYRYEEHIEIGDSRRRAAADLRIASPTAFEALGLHMAAGRWFTAGDHEGAPLAAVVNQTMASRLWSGSNPIGDRFVYGRRTLHVVGVVSDVHERGARAAVTPTFYLTTGQQPTNLVALAVRADAGVDRVDQAVTAALAQMRGRIAAGSPRRLEDAWWRQLADTRFLTVVLASFSLVALALALIGVHGVLRFVVAQRAREMGIRKALGATRVDLITLVLGQALRFALPGCLAGLAAAVAAAPAIRALLFEVTPTDPLTLVTATAVLIGAVVIGAYFPARRAGEVDPALSLRAE